jgi:hypothetical protein
LRIYGAVVNDLLELPVDEVIQVRYSPRTTKQALRSEEDKRLPNRLAVRTASHLTAQHVKILGRRGAVAHLHIVLRAELEKSFDARARMLGALPFVSMRQQQD